MTRSDRWWAYKLEYLNLCLTALVSRVMLSRTASQHDRYGIGVYVLQPATLRDTWNMHGNRIRQFHLIVFELYWHLYGDSLENWHWSLYCLNSISLMDTNENLVINRLCLIHRNIVYKRYFGRHIFLERESPGCIFHLQMMQIYMIVIWINDSLGFIGYLVLIIPI